MKRNHHINDYVIDPFQPKNRRRAIGTYINYKTYNGVFAPVNINITQVQSVPPNWEGQFDFGLSSENAPLRFFAHDTTDPSNRAMIGMNIDQESNTWVNIKATNIDNNVSTQYDSNSVWWPNLWTNSKLKFIHCGHFVQKEIELSAPGHPSQFDFLMRIRSDMLFDLTDNKISLSNDLGIPKIFTKSPYGWDSNGNYIRCKLEFVQKEGPGNIYRRIRLTPHPDDLATATYPVTLDPTVTLPYTSVDDTQILNISTGTPPIDERNYGGSVTVQVRNTPYNGLWRYDESLIPAGNITGHRFYSKATGGGYTADVSFYKIVAASADWVEGTANGATQEGSTCWKYKKWSATTPTNWAGGGAFSSSDYVADASPPTKTTSWSATNYNSNVITLPTAWATDWRSNPSNNGGIVGIWVADGGVVALSSTEDTTDQPYFEVDYEGITQYYTFMMATRRRLN